VLGRATMAGDGGGAGTLPPHVLVPPTWLPEARLEVSVHSCPARMLPDLQRVFPSLPPEAAGRLLILPTFQPTKHDMVSITVDCDDERDALLEHVRRETARPPMGRRRPRG